MPPTHQPKYGAVKYEKRDRVAWVTLNQPEAMNSLSQDLVDDLVGCIEEVNRDDDVLVAILTSEGGRAFCAGMNLKMRAAVDAGAGGPTGGRTFNPGAAHPVVGSCPKPIIAAIDGYCLAGGLQLAARCDIRIATEKSSFGMPEPRFAGGAPHNSLDSMDGGFVPLGEAMWIILTGSRMTAQRAYQIGLIQALLPDRDALFKEAERIAGEIKLCSPLGIRAAKTGILAYRDLPTPPQGVRPKAYAREINKVNEEALSKSEDRFEGPRAFAEKRLANWKGR